MPLLEVEHLQKVYTARFGAVQVEALRDNIFHQLELYNKGNAEKAASGPPKPLHIGNEQ